jgi:hypothetical protein
MKFDYRVKPRAASRGFSLVRAKLLECPLTVRDKKGKARTLTKQEVMIEGMTNTGLRWSIAMKLLSISDEAIE